MKVKTNLKVAGIGVAALILYDSGEKSNTV
jgi:hypothetical protein